MAGVPASKSRRAWQYVRAVGRKTGRQLKVAVKAFGRWLGSLPGKVGRAVANGLRAFAKGVPSFASAGAGGAGLACVTASITPPPF